MTSPRLRGALVVAVAAATLFACWPWLFAVQELSAPTPAPGGGTAAPVSADLAPAAVDPAPAAGAIEADAALAREAAAVPAGDGTGSLLVHVVWGDDKTPAADVEVSVYRSGTDALFDEPHGSTDATGSVVFARLAPGNVYPSVRRGDSGEHQKVAIVGGQRAEVTLEAKMGMNAKGRVVNGNGVGVADAEVVTAGWTGGKTQTLARTAADGSFTLRCVPTHCHIGARKAGWRPSSMRQFTASDGSTVEFTIVLGEAGASLAGVVLDPRGQPVAGAAVRAGSRDQNNHDLPDGARAMGPQCELVRTGADGRFLFASVVPGKVPLAARARGLAPWQQDVDVAAGRREELTIRLLAGTTVFGTVRDAAGEVLAKVEVMAGVWDDLGSRRVASAADGTFRIEGLPAGELKVRADDDERGKASTTLQLVPGEQRRWDPVLAAGLVLRGRVLDHDGKPVGKVMVEGQQERPSRDDPWFAFENTGADGRFVLANCREDKPVRLTFRRKSTFPELVKTGVVPGPEELVVTLPKEAWVHIRGTVLGPDGAVLPNVHVSPHMQNSMSGSPAETADGRTGAFRYGPYPPGTYSLTLSAAGFPTLRMERTLGPDETWDLGTLKFVRGGNLVVQLVGSDVPPKWSLNIHDEAGAQVESIETQQGAGRSSPLAPGLYRLQVAGEKFAAAAHAFEIRADRETRLDVPVTVGVLAKIECALPAGTPANAANRVQVTVRGAGGAVVWRGIAWSRGSGLPQVSIALLPGDYAVRAEAGDLAATGSLEIATPGPVSLDLTLKPR